MQSPKCLRGLLPALLILLAACSSSTTSTEGGENAAAPEVAAGDSGTPEVAAPTTGEQEIPANIDVAAYRDTARTAMFVPAPSEFQAALKATEASSVDIRAMVVDSERSIADKSKPIIALETGVRLANVLLTAQTGDKAVVLKRMKSAREGLAAIGASDAVMAETDKVIGDFESDTLAVGELSPALD
ncbi:MAG: hypothetical protein VX498_11410, partial [Myxococcota bacterium]|nr:hypothetical protein [Myxococcota bacterium]